MRITDRDVTENKVPYTNDTQYALVLWNDLGCQLVWVRPSHEAALQTLRAWFAIELVKLSESNDMVGDYPDPAIMSYEQITEWVSDGDLGWDILLLPINTPIDPLRDFIENNLQYYLSINQERVRHSVIRAVGWVSGWSPIEDYEKLDIDQLPVT